jgi:predicted enzyme related to lactoylglutathione lyase
MTETAAPVYAPGKICYIEMPAKDIAESAEFYRSVFGWQIRQRGDGATAFDDTVGQVSGTWVTDLPPATAPGLRVHIMVARIEETIAAIERAGGEIVQPVDPASPEVWATFRDPAGNVLGIYKQPGLAESLANN